MELLGHVESLNEFYEKCSIVINSTAAGTGLKIKTVEALAHGRRVVAWPLGVDGVSSGLLRFCYVARDWYEFSRMVGEALEQSRENFTSAEMQEIETALDPAFVYAELGDLIDQHVRNGPTGAEQ